MTRILRFTLWLCAFALLFPLYFALKTPSSTTMTPVERLDVMQELNAMNRDMTGRAEQLDCTRFVSSESETAEGKLCLSLIYNKWQVGNELSRQRELLRDQLSEASSR